MGGGAGGLSEGCGLKGGCHCLSKMGLRYTHA